MKRGDIVLVDFPFPAGGGSKVRPALVVQSDHNNARLQDTIVVLITSNTSRAGLEATQYLIDSSHRDWTASGLAFPSVVKCENIYTFNNKRILRTIGRLSDLTMRQVNDCLKASLDLP
jgi:mRNA interferase MazF